MISEKGVTKNAKIIKTCIIDLIQLFFFTTKTKGTTLFLCTFLTDWLTD